MNKKKNETQDKESRDLCRQGSACSEDGARTRGTDKYVPKSAPTFYKIKNCVGNSKKQENNEQKSIAGMTRHPPGTALAWTVGATKTCDHLNQTPPGTVLVLGTRPGRFPRWCLEIMSSRVIYIIESGRENQTPFPVQKSTPQN